MLTIRPAQERGRADHGWLDSRHTFSFADYYDARHMGFRALRVINEDRVRAGAGFGAHSHRDMEILSYVLEGALQHKDSLGTGSVIRPGELQRMSAGRGITHSEYNASQSESVHFLQIWLQPSVRGIAPSYEQKAFAPEELRGRLRLLAAPDARDGSLTIHTDASVHAGRFEQGEAASFELAAGRHAYLHIARGQLRVQGSQLGAGDGAAISDETALRIEGVEGGGEVLLFDLA